MPTSAGDVTADVKNRLRCKVAGCGLRFWLQTTDARSGGKRGGDGRQYRDDDVQNFIPKFFFHGSNFLVGVNLSSFCQSEEL